MYSLWFSRVLLSFFLMSSFPVSQLDNFLEIPADCKISMNEAVGEYECRRYEIDAEHCRQYLAECPNFERPCS